MLAWVDLRFLENGNENDILTTNLGEKKKRKKLASSRYMV
jgi:hypothetical protein